MFFRDGMSCVSIFPEGYFSQSFVLQEENPSYDPLFVVHLSSPICVSICCQMWSLNSLITFVCVIFVLTVKLTQDSMHLRLSWLLSTFIP